MGTGAVYVTLSGLKERHPLLIAVETGFFFLNIALFSLNSTTLLLQAICASAMQECLPLTDNHVPVYPRQAWRLLQDPVKGIFVPLIVSILDAASIPH